MVRPDFLTLWRTTTFRLAAATAALFALAAAVLVAVVYWQVNAVLSQEAAAQVRRQSQRLVALSSRASPAEVRGALAQAAGADPKFLYRYHGAASGHGAAGGGARDGNVARWPAGLGADRDVQVFRVQTGSGGERLAIGVVRSLADGGRVLIARDATSLADLAHRVRWWFVVGGLVISIVGLFAGLLVSRLVLRRIGDITSTSARIMSGRLSERIALDGSNDELDELAGNLNQMLARIEQLMAGFREVSDNIAHDLKTPLNRLRNRAEDALNRPGRERESLEHILGEADDLIRTFNALLQVARLEAGAADTERVAIDLSEFARDVVEFYAPMVEDQGADISFHGRHGVVVAANRQLLGQALTNLIENALKYGAGSQPEDHDRAVVAIAVTVDRTDAGAVLRVADRGRGIAAAERQQALKRFGRLDSSRSQPGTGLGLSLVRAVARLHGGDISLADNNPGLIASIVLPIATMQDGAPIDDGPAAGAAADGDRANGHFSSAPKAYT